jgi:hypothetical protein
LVLAVWLEFGIFHDDTGLSLPCAVVKRKVLSKRADTVIRATNQNRLQDTNSL